MKTIFDKTIRKDLIDRINTLDKSKKAQWGKMNIYQMLNHCIIWEEWIQGKTTTKYKQEFLGLLFGKMALKSMIKDEKPIRRNLPTSTYFKVSVTDGDTESAKNRWIALIEAYEHYSNPEFIHDFFGKMTKEQIGRLAYKHTDHHLRQFSS
jgi:hypothetical protein